MRFTSILKQILLEAQSQIDFLINTYTKPKVKADGTKKKPKLSLKELVNLIAMDPQVNLEGIDLDNPNINSLKDLVVTNTTSWIIKQYLNLNQQTEIPFGERGFEQDLKRIQDLFFENGYKLKDDLKKLDRFKERIPKDKRDVTKLTRDELYDLVKDFSLEKIKATSDEKKEAAETFVYPGSEVAFRGPNWTVVKITENTPLGKSAAVYFGGNKLGTKRGETEWCTSSPGYNWFERYIKTGPLYVILPNNWSGKRGEISGLPATRYQFHFQENQFMDADDRSIDLVKFLNEATPELKDFFKPEFVKGLTVGGTKLVISGFNQGAIGKFVGLYGLDELIDNLPETLEEFQIQNSNDNNNIIINIPPSISRLKNLEMIMFDRCIDKVPDEICELKNLRFLSLVNNKGLKKIPDCVIELPNLLFINIKGSDNVKLSPAIKQHTHDYGEGMYSVE